jgi:hypothetical protein
MYLLALESQKGYNHLIALNGKLLTLPPKENIV